MSSRRLTWVLGAVVVAGASLSMNPAAAADGAEVYVVQGLPRADLDVAIDGRSVATDVGTSDVVGPFDVDAGEHTMTFTDDGEVVLERTMTAKAASSSDVVVHLPVAAAADPIATVFDNDLSSVPRGKASLTVAHTADVPPADIRVDGRVLFANVANGESLDLTVPADTYSIELVPTGRTSPAFLGPLDLKVTAGALNRVYAVGDPGSGAMSMAVHVIDTGSTGSKAPTEVNTGTGGQAAMLAEWFAR